MVSVTLRQISKSYESGRPVLQDISLEIADGEFFFLLGPSGCGKSTLLRLLAGFLTPDQGVISFGGQDMTRVPADRREAGMVFQNYALWPHLTVGENVAFGLEVRKVSADERQRRVAEALATVGLSDFAGRKPTQLSGGQQQRVALARALVIRPRVLLLDEPLSNLDARLRLSMRAELRRLCKSAGLTAIYVTHDQKEALSMADRLAVLHEGRLQQVGTPREVYSRPVNRFVADFIGECNFLPGTLVSRDANGHGTVRCAVGELASTAIAAHLQPGQKVVVALRPEWLRLSSAAPATSANTFTALLHDLTYLGEIGQRQLRAGDCELKAFELNPPDRAPGDLLHCQVAPADVVVLPEG